MGEIAAVAVLDGSQVSDLDALQMIAAIARWVTEEAPRGATECGSIVRRLNGMTASVDIDHLDDREALALFERVLDVLRT